MAKRKRSKAERATGVAAIGTGAVLGGAVGRSSLERPAFGKATRFERLKRAAGTLSRPVKGETERQAARRVSARATSVKRANKLFRGRIGKGALIGGGIVTGGLALSRYRRRKTRESQGENTMRFAEALLESSTLQEIAGAGMGLKVAKSTLLGRARGKAAQVARHIKKHKLAYAAGGAGVGGIALGRASK